MSDNSAVASPEGIFSGGGDEYMKEELRIKLANERSPLGIVAATPYKVNQFKDAVTSFTLIYEKERYVLELSHNEVRQRQAEAVVEKLSGMGVKVVGPVFLTQVQTKSGQVAWALDDQPMPDDRTAVSLFRGGGRQTVSAPAAQVQSPVSQDEDDDIPF